VWLGTSLLYFRIHLILALAVCGLATQCALGLFLLVRSFTDGADLINSDGQNHTISVYLSDLNTTLFGFEELNGLGDGDYNDGASPVLLIDSTVEAS
jgi:hypothetical protein